MADPLPDGVLPVVDPDGTVAAGRELQATPRVRTGGLVRRLSPRGNTKAGDAPLRRQEVTRTAQGKPTLTDAVDWRDDLHSGQRSKAAGKLATPGHTHNSDSGFGIA